MKNLLVSFLLLLSAAPSVALAQLNSYFEVGYSANTIKDESGTLGSFNNGGIKITLGREVTDWLAIEGSLGTGLGDDTNNVGGVAVTVETKEFASLYLRPFKKLNDQVEFFARAGYFRGKLQGSAAGQTFSDSEGDVSYGVGAAFSLSKTSAIVLDVMQYLDKDDTRITGFGIGYRHRF